MGSWRRVSCRLIATIGKVLDDSSDAIIRRSVDYPSYIAGKLRSGDDAMHDNSVAIRQSDYAVRTSEDVHGGYHKLVSLRVSQMVALYI